MKQSERVKLFEQARATLLERVPAFAEKAAQIFAKNGWVWNSPEDEKSFVPNKEQIEETARRLIMDTDLDCPSPEHQTSDQSTGRIGVMFVLYDDERLCADLVLEAEDVHVTLYASDIS